MQAAAKKTVAGLVGLGLACIAIAGTFYAGQCTWGVASVKGDPIKDGSGRVVDYSLPWGGNAVDWCRNAAPYARVDNQQTLGAIVVFSGPTVYGHVGIVTGTNQMRSMNDTGGVGVWTYNRSISTFPRVAAPLTPSCYIHYREDRR